MAKIEPKSPPSKLVWLTTRNPDRLHPEERRAFCREIETGQLPHVVGGCHLQRLRDLFEYYAVNQDSRHFKKLGKQRWVQFCTNHDLVDSESNPGYSRARNEQTVAYLDAHSMALEEVHDIFDHVAARRLPFKRPFSHVARLDAEANRLYQDKANGRASLSYSLHQPGSESVGFVPSKMGNGQVRRGDEARGGIAKAGDYYREAFQNAHRPPQDFLGFLELLAELSHAIYPSHTLDRAMRQVVRGDVMSEQGVSISMMQDREPINRDRLTPESRDLHARLMSSVQRRGSEGLQTPYDTEPFGRESALLGESWCCSLCGTISMVRWLDLGGDRGMVPHPFSRCAGEGCNRILQEQQSLANEVEDRMQDLWLSYGRTEGNSL